MSDLLARRQLPTRMQGSNISSTLEIASAPAPTPKAGRPPKLMPTEPIIRQIGELAALQCTQDEAAAVLGVCDDTLRLFLGQHKKAAEAWELGRERGKASLRRLQFEAAQKGNVTAQIWLGKQWLGQKDKCEQEISGKDGVPFSRIQVTCVESDGTYWDLDEGRKRSIHDRKDPANPLPAQGSRPRRRQGPTLTDLTPNAREMDGEPGVVRNSRGAQKAADRAKAQNQFLAMLAEGVTVSGAAKAAGVTRQAAYLWRDGNEEFAAAWDEHAKIGVESVEDVVRQHAAKDWRAAEVWLRAHHRNKWGTHVQTDQNVTLTEKAIAEAKAQGVKEL